MVAALRIAVTGGTGFVGSRLLLALAEAGHEVRALTRRPMANEGRLAWVRGSLEDPQALAELADGADALIHVAGVLNADEVGFEAGNVHGTAAVLDAAKAAEVRRFVHVSSLAAREPQLSRYGGSKARSEVLVRESGLDFTIVRPPAVYGPGDKEMLDLFKMARGGQIYMPPKGRLSLIHVDDLARLLVVLAETEKPPQLTEPDDGKPGGWTHREFGNALAEAVGVPARTIATPRFVLEIACHVDRLVRGKRAKLTPDRVAYFCHPDWVVEPALAPPPDLWAPAIDTRQGLKATREWYQANRLLGPS